ncbi:MAG: SUF system NifU family Fe-S cluster assembly protein [bacterium]|nr:SUF system NifU family Fe-S cluster assembly protein [bacterium]
MSVRNLYQQMILDHNKNPRNFKDLELVTHRAHGKNPLCGDDYFVFLHVDNGVVEDIGFKGVGCAISKSSASIMTTIIKGMKVDDVLSMKDDFIALLTRDDVSEEQKKNLGRLSIFEGVKEYPVRVKCATLIWRALESSLLLEQSETVCTE